MLIYIYKKMCFTYLFFCIINFTYSQNLVINPSFEDTLNTYNSFVYSKNISNCQSWTGDNVVYCNRGGFNYIKKRKYVDSSFSGSCHIEMSFKPFELFYLRDYVVGALKEPLRKNTTYSFSYHIKPQKKTAFYSENLQILFLEKMDIDPFIKPKNNISGIAENPDKNGWIKIHGQYLAKGGEQFIILNYFDNNEEDTKKTKKWRKKYLKVLNLVDMVEVYSEKHTIAQVELNSLKVKTNDIKYISKKVFFDSDSYFINERYFEIIVEIANEAKKNSAKIIQITGYADQQGEKDYNQELSTKRANQIKKELMRLKVVNPIEVYGKGVYTENVEGHKKRFVLIEFSND